MTQETLPGLLEPYHAYLPTERHRELARSLLAWALPLCCCQRGPAWHARSAFYAAVFGAHCAPPGATLHHCLPSARFCLFFLQADDGPVTELAALAERLRSGRPTAEGELGVFHDVLLDEMRAQRLRTGPFRSALTDFCLATASEPAQNSRTMTFAEFRALRRRTVGVLPYLHCWMAVHEMPVPEEGSAEDQLTEWTVEVGHLVNDLASYATEACGGPGNDDNAVSNEVLFRAAATGDLPQAVDTVVARYNHLARAFPHAGHGPLPVLLRAIADGNLVGHLGLTATRYPGATKILRRLHRIPAL
ncbi:terpene synthase family protein [Streptomyces sp. NPDC101393]|uniref:terpene synthase family protein n=1 Tax=Streptomyces sp. NPDC101393 TaxID=3366141 RepID=UPI0037F7DEEC